ncbi:MAG: LysR family transcriptional regulator substrate-binding protein, partial [Pseudomonadales bacterium]|nr:LysR family transcriptional regulator substrate-binding protein [Pseudomonadales bacterium]
VAIDHPLAQQQQVTLAQLTRHQPLLPDLQTFTRQITAERFTQQGLNLEVRMSTNNLDTIKMMVSNGLGWSLLPQSMIDDSLHVLITDQLPIYRSLGYIYHRERTLSNAAKQFIALLAD